MRFEWFVCKYKDGKFIDKTPHAMTKREAESLADLGMQRGGEYTFIAKHRKEI